MQTKEYYLDKALKQAKYASDKRNYPIWALLLVNDTLEVSGQNKVVTTGNHNFHAEIDILQKARDFQKTKDRKTLFVTLEPCNNCAKALVDYGIDEVCYVLEDPAWGGKNILEWAGIKVTQLKHGYDEYLSRMIGFMQEHGGYPEVLSHYLSIEKDGSNTFDEALNRAIDDRFTRISASPPDAKVRQIVYDNTLHYLKNALLRTPEDKHFLVYEGYGADMERIITFCQKEIMEKEDFVLSEDIIKNLHKTLYPNGYIQKEKDSLGREFIWMIPGELRIINLSSTENANKEIYAKFSDVENLLQEMIVSHNTSANKEEAMLYFLADFSRVHPFGDGNGRVNYILVDLLLLKLGQGPLCLGKKEGSERLRLHAILDEVCETRDLESLRRFIGESVAK